MRKLWILISILAAGIVIFIAGFQAGYNSAKDNLGYQMQQSYSNGYNAGTNDQIEITNGILRFGGLTELNTSEYEKQICEHKFDIKSYDYTPCNLSSDNPCTLVAHVEITNMTGLAWGKG